MNSGPTFHIIPHVKTSSIINDSACQHKRQDRFDINSKNNEKREKGIILPVFAVVWN